MKRKAIGILLSLVLAVSAAALYCVPAMAETDSEEAVEETAEEAGEESAEEAGEEEAVTGFNIVCGDTEMTAEEAEAFVQGTQPMVPSDKAAELLGIEPENVAVAEGEEGEITVVYTLEGSQVFFTVDSMKAKILTEDGEEKSMYLEATPFQPDGDAIYIPLHYLAAAAGFNGEWVTEDDVTSFILTEREEDGPDMVIYLTRHGKTLFNTVGRVQGWCDSPLTEAGIEVAENLGLGLAADEIAFEAAYSSDLGRQRQTARVVLDTIGQTDLPVKEIFGLRETFFGDWEGEKESYRDEVYCDIAGTENIGEVYAQGNLFNEITLQTDESGTAEASDESFERIYEALNEIQAENRETGGNILVVTSGGITTNLVGHFTTVRGGIANAAITYFESVDGILILGKVGDTSYADQGAEIRAAEAAEEEAEEEPAEEEAGEEMEEEAPAIGMANPWTDTTAEEAMQVLGIEMGVPEGAEDVVYRMLADEQLLEMDFTLDGLDFTARMKPSAVVEEIEDISGLYYSWVHEEECEVGYTTGLLRQAESDEGIIENCIWLDVVPGFVYSLTTSAEDLDGFDLSAVAGQVFKPMQGDS